MAENDNKKIENLYYYDIIDDYPIFQYLKPYDNDKLSEMSGVELQDLIILLADYYISLRKGLNLDQNIPFGLEMEYSESASGAGIKEQNEIKERIKEIMTSQFPDEEWKIKRTNHAARRIVSPILTDKMTDWKQVNKVCSIMSPLVKSGGEPSHICIGAHLLGDNANYWLNFIKIWSVYENIIYRFASGPYLTSTEDLRFEAKPLADILWNRYRVSKSRKDDTNDILDHLDYISRSAVGFDRVHRNSLNSFKYNNTIRINCLNSSFDPAIWQNDINFFVRLLCYAKNPDFNDDIIEERHRINDGKFNKYNKLNWHDLDYAEQALIWHNKIYLDQALELCDMIFTNNFDKVNFLRQYLKSYQVEDGLWSQPEPVTLTKKMDRLL